MRTPKPPVAALLLSLLVGAPLLAQSWRGSAALEVQADDPKGRGVDGAQVTLVFLGAAERPSPQPVRTGPDGKVAVGGLAAGRWTVEVRKEGFMVFLAEIVLDASSKPSVLTASQHVVPGSLAPMRVRLRKARNASPAEARSPADQPAPVAAPAAQAEAPAPAPAPAPKAEAPAPTPAPAPRAEAPAPAPAPAPKAEAPAPAPAPAPKAEAPAPAPAAAPRAEAPAPAPAPAPEAEAPPPAPAPAPSPSPAAVVVAGDGLRAELTLNGGEAGCPIDLQGRLSLVPLSAFDRVVESLPEGCGLLRIDLPTGAGYAGARLEAAADGPAAECSPATECPVGSCQFVGEPVLRRSAAGSSVLVAFQTTTSTPRTAVLTVFLTAP